MLLVPLLVVPATAQAQTMSPRSFDVRLGGGLARVVMTLEITGPAGEVAQWDEPLPEGAGLAGLVACRGETCLRGVFFYRG